MTQTIYKGIVTLLCVVLSPAFLGGMIVLVDMFSTLSERKKKS